MERWRIFGLATLSSIVFLAGLFLVAEAGRARLRDASEQMQSAMARRILVCGSFYLAAAIHPALCSAGLRPVRLVQSEEA